MGLWFTLALMTAAAVFAVLVGLPLRVLFAPLFTRHRLTGTDLVLHYGLHKVSIPRRCISLSSTETSTLQATLMSR